MSKKDYWNNIKIVYPGYKMTIFRKTRIWFTRLWKMPAGFTFILWVSTIIIALILGSESKFYKMELTATKSDFLFQKEFLNKKIGAIEKERNHLKKKVVALSDAPNNIKNDIKKYILHISTQVPESVAEEISNVVLTKSNQYDIPYTLYVGLMQTESHFNPYAVSKKGARGLMQVMHSVWVKKAKKFDYTKQELHDITKGVDAGSQVLRQYLDETNGDVRKALYKYVGGPNPMKPKFHPSKTQFDYANSIFTNMGSFTIYRAYQ